MLARHEVRIRRGAGPGRPGEWPGYMWSVRLLVREAARVVTVAAGLSVFRTGDDGTLDFVRKYDVETGSKTQFWMGIV